MLTDEDATSTPNPTILKRDVLGRVTIPKAQREALLDEFERSGLKGKPFARLVGVNYQSFASWIQKRRRARGDYAALAVARCEASVKTRLPKPLRLMEAVPAAAMMQAAPVATVSADALEVMLPGGAKLMLSTSSQVELAAQLIQTLRTPC